MPTCNLIYFFYLVIGIVLYVSEIDECSSDPCQNDALCQDRVNDYTCTCKDGYSGTNCEIGNLI